MVSINKESEPANKTAECHIFTALLNV